MPTSHNNYLRLATLFAALALSACSTIDDILSSNAKVDYKRGYEFDEISTMNVACGMDPESENAPMNMEQIQRMNRALEQALERQGITVVRDPAEADASVSWHVVTQQQSSLREYNAESYYQCWRCGPAISSTSVVKYTEGTFVVDIVDPALQKSVWRGVMQGRLPGVRNMDVQQSRFDQAAREMFAKFPPGIFIDGIY